MMNYLILFLLLFCPQIESDESIRILVVKHASHQTLQEGVKINLGDQNVPISDQGVQEAILLKRQLEKCGIVVHRIFCSDLDPAVTTAAILASGTAPR